MPRDVRLAHGTVPALDADESSTATVALQLPPATAAGTYYVLAKADGPGAVAETARPTTSGRAAR